MPLTAGDVSHVYCRREPGEAKALDRINVSIDRGEFVLVTGAAGSGKTTLLQCLSGLMRPTTGRVAADGAAATSIQFPERALFASTVYDDVAFGPRNMGVSKDETDERVLEAVEAVGLDKGVLARDPRALSHGQRRLAALAGVIAVRPRYLLLDEPTAGLDSKGRSRVIRALMELNEAGTAMIVASHDLGHFMGICGRMLVLDRGKIIFDGPPEEAVSCDAVYSAGLALPPSMLAARWLRLRGVDVPWDVSPVAVAGHIRGQGLEGTRMD
jgi:energy-coupling factor transport system ATP-binding protein